MSYNMFNTLMIIPLLFLSFGLIFVVWGTVGQITNPGPKKKLKKKNREKYKAQKAKNRKYDNMHTLGLGLAVIGLSIAVVLIVIDMVIRTLN